MSTAFFRFSIQTVKFCTRPLCVVAKGVGSVVYRSFNISLHVIHFHIVVVILTLTRIIKSVVIGQAPVTLELRNTPGKTHTQPKGGTCIYNS